MSLIQIRPNMCPRKWLSQSGVRAIFATKYDLYLLPTLFDRRKPAQ